METINNHGYREVSFQVQDIKNILSTPELLEKISADSYSAYMEFYDYSVKEGFVEDHFFRMTLAPDANVASGLRELIRVMEAVNNRAVSPFDDSDMGAPSSEASMQ